jgi:hypothetical protein
MDDDIGYSIQETSGRGFIIMGSTSSFGAGWYDFWLIRTDGNGDTIWTRTYGDTGWESGQFGCQTSDSGFIMTGYTDSYGAGEDDVWLVRADKNGNKLWDKTFGGIFADKGCFVQEISDSGFIITGATDSYGVGGLDIWVIRTDRNGNKLWDKTFGGTAMSFEWGHCVRQTSDGGFIVVGEKEQDVWLIKIMPETGVEENKKFKVQDAKLDCYPNPFIRSTVISYQLPDRLLTTNNQQLTTISLKIYDMAGNLIHTLVDKEMKPGHYSITWNPACRGERPFAPTPPGIYFAKLNTRTHNLTKKLILLR